MKISIVVAVYNGAKYLSELIDSLQKTNWPQGENEVIFVDNASSDNSSDLIRNNLVKFLGREKEHSHTELIVNQSNLGYAAGNNVGIKKALEEVSDYVVLLNQDTVVEPKWLVNLIKVAESDAKIGAVQSLLLYYDKKDTVNSWGNKVHFLGFGFAGGNLEKFSSTNFQFSKKEITYASGAAVLYKAEVLRQVGLLDERLEMYHDDMDMGLRLRCAGYKSYLAPGSIVYHKYTYTKIDELGHYKYYLMERNRLLIMLSYYRIKTLLLIFPAWLAMELGLLLFAIMRGFWREKMKGYFWIITKLQIIIFKRREIQKLRHCEEAESTQQSRDRRARPRSLAMTDRELMHDFVGSISYQEINNPLLQMVGNPIMSLYWFIVKRFI